MPDIIVGKTLAGSENIKIGFDEIVELIDDFCNATDCYIRLIDNNFNYVTPFPGTTSEEKYILENLGSDICQRAVYPFINNGLEDVCEIETECPYLYAMSAAVRGESKDVIATWLIVCLDEKNIPEDMFIPAELRRTSPDRLAKAVSFLGTLTKKIIKKSTEVAYLKSDLNQIASKENELCHRLMKNEVMTEILRMMESDNSFSKIAEDMLAESGKYIDVSNAAIMQISSDGKNADIICEWSAKPADALTEEMSGIETMKLPFLNGRPYTISSDTVVPEQFGMFMSTFRIKAGIFLPITINGKAGMYLLYLSRNAQRRWNSEEMKFTNDIKRILHTVLVKRITRNSLASSYSALEAILENAGCGVTVNDVVRKEVLYSNETYKQMFSDEEEKQKLDTYIFNNDDEASGVSGYYLEKNDKYYNIGFTNIHWVDGRKVRLATFYDVTDIKNYQKRFEKQANEDYLTGLYNRKKCGDDLTDVIKQVRMYGEHAAFLCVDLDDFGNINDALGHDNGDELLKRVSTALNDIKYIKNHIYRVGGDAFAIIVTPENFDKLSDIIELIERMFQKPWSILGRDCYITCSMGVVMIPDDATDQVSVFSRVHIALQDAKKSGKNRLEYYHMDSDNISTKRLDLENYMRKAVEEGCKEFEVYYQPLFSATQNNCVGAEALVRWNSPELGFVSPADFIPLAEYLGLVVPIGEHVLIEAAKNCKHWNDMGHPEYKVSVNLSVIQLLQADIVDVIKRAIRISGIMPSHLGLEVTESLAINDIELMKNVLNDIRALGCLVALDDFGTGYSSLNHIRTLPIDTIKIDKCFVDDIEKDEFSDRFVKTVTELAESLNMGVCAEGVETLNQKDIISNLNVDYIQGYVFDKPLTRDEFDKKYIMA